MYAGLKKILLFAQWFLSMHMSLASDVCLTTECKNFAKSLQDSMDLDVDPCSNFYQFACGKFVHSNISFDESFYNTFSEDEKIVDEQLKHIFESPITESDSEISAFLKSAYEKCADFDVIENQGLSPLKELLNEIGEWAIFNNKNYNEFSWVNSALKFREMGLSESYFLDFSIAEERKAILLSPPSHHQITHNQLTNSTIIDGYQSYAMKVVELLGFDVKQVQEELAELLNFEIQLINSSMSPEEVNAMPWPWYKPMTVEAMTQKWPSVPWKTYLNGLLKPGPIVNDSRRVYVKDPNYISNLEKLLNTTSKKTQANYAVWSAIVEAIPYLPAKFREAAEKFKLLQSGVESLSEPKWRNCMNTIRGYFSVGVSGLYISEYFNNNDKKIVTDMIKNIKEIFSHNINKIKYLDNTTKRFFHSKLEAMEFSIGYSNELVDDKIIRSFYQNLKLDADNFLRILANTRKFMMDQKALSLARSTEGNSLVSKSHVVIYPYSNIGFNEAGFPAAYLQGKKSVRNRPDYLNYAVIGTAIADTLVYQVDNQHRVLDKNGDPYKWSNENANRNYEEQVECLKNQLQNMTKNNLAYKVENHPNDIDNYILKSEGPQLAYSAYQNFANKKIEQRLPGLEKYSANKLFWLAFARMQCTIVKDEKEFIDSYGLLPEYKLNGGLKNIAEFSKDFGCPTDSFMNPSKKCNLL